MRRLRVLFCRTDGHYGMRWIKFFALMLWALVVCAEEIEPLPIGNFSLPKSQRPGAFYSFGSKILEPGQWQLATKPNIFKETDARFIGMPNTLQYGLSKYSAVYVAFPATLDLQTKVPSGYHHAAGMDNLGVQGEYEFFSRSSLHDKEEAGVLLGVTAPTGSRQVTSHWTSYFVGGTYTHTWVKWDAFSSMGYLMFEGPFDIRPGNIFYFEVGGGYDLKSETDRYNLAFFCEINGQYSEKRPNTGYVETNGVVRPRGSALNDGYLLYVSPSLWYSNKKWITQLGVSVPIAQYWPNTNQKVDYYASLAVLYTIV